MALLAEYGTWKSPITSDLIVAGTIGLSSPLFHGEDIYWLESRPLEGGRNVIVRQSPDGETEDVTPPLLMCVAEYMNTVEALLQSIKTLCILPILRTKEYMSKKEEKRHNL